MEETDSNLRIRPRFRLEVPYSPEILKEKIRLALDINDEMCKGNIVDNHVILKIPISQQHYWSPMLTIDLEPIDSGSLIRGLFGPKPEIWTMFVFFYSAIGFLTLMGLIFGFSQLMLKMNAYGLWAVPAGGSLLIGLFVISKFGQRLGQKQMHQLKEFLDNSLNL